MNTKPEALRLADELEKYVEVATAIAAVAELRRLHALNAELLEALKDVMDWFVDRHETDEAAVAARAAIARAEGKQ